MAEVNVLQVVTVINLVVWYVLPLALLLIIYITIGLVLMRTTDKYSVTRSSQYSSSFSQNCSFPQATPKTKLVVNSKSLVRPNYRLVV